MTFQIFGIVVGLSGFVYIALYFLIMRKYDKERLKQAAGTIEHLNLGKKKFRC